MCPARRTGPLGAISTEGQHDIGFLGQRHEFGGPGELDGIDEVFLFGADDWEHGRAGQ